MSQRRRADRDIPVGGAGARARRRLWLRGAVLGAAGRRRRRRVLRLRRRAPPAHSHAAHTAGPCRRVHLLLPGNPNVMMLRISHKESTTGHMSFP